MTINQLLTDLRILANDTPTSNNIRQEVPLGPKDGVNKNFRLQNYPVVAGSAYITQDATFRSQSGFTLDAPNGLLNFTTAPLSTVKVFEADYNFYWFTDVDHTQFLTNGSQSVSAADPTLVTDGLVPALLQYALHYFWMRRASQYAHRYSSSGGTAGHSVDAVTKAFKALADSAWAAAQKLRDDFYAKQGQQESPSSGTLAYNIDPYSPMR